MKGTRDERLGNRPHTHIGVAGIELHHLSANRQNEQKSRPVRRGIAPAITSSIEARVERGQSAN